MTSGDGYTLFRNLWAVCDDSGKTEYEGWIKDRQRSISIAAPQNKLRIFTTSTVLTDILCAKERISPKEIVKSKIFLCDLDAQRLRGN